MTCLDPRHRVSSSPVQLERVSSCVVFWFLVCVCVSECKMAKVFLGCLNVRLVQFLKKFSLKLFKNLQKKRSYSFLQRCSTEGCHIIFSKDVRLLNHQQHSFLPTFLKLLEDSERKPGCRRHVDDAAKSSQRGWLARRVGIIDFYGLSATIFKRFS